MRRCVAMRKTNSETYCPLTISERHPPFVFCIDIDSRFASAPSSSTTVTGMSSSAHTPYQDVPSTVVLPNRTFYPPERVVFRSHALRQQFEPEE